MNKDDMVGGSKEVCCVNNEVVADSVIYTIHKSSRSQSADPLHTTDDVVVNHSLYSLVIPYPTTNNAQHFTQIIHCLPLLHSTTQFTG